MEYCVLLFDGDCGLCNATVRFIINKNKKRNIKFIPLHSETANKILSKYPQQLKKINTLYFVEKDKIYYKSIAALYVAKHLKGLWPLVYSFVIIPRFLRDWVYDCIAKNRKKYFKNSNYCSFMTPDIKHLFEYEPKN